MEQMIAHLQLPSLKRCAIIAAGFFVLLFAIYGPSLRNGFVRWDDGMLITENPIVRSLSPRTIGQAFTTYDPELYIPLTFISYQVDHLIGGDRPEIYHFTNVLWHLVNALLVGAIIFALTRRGWASLACAALFAVHPLHTEAVAWASARKDLLSTAFFLLSMLLFLACLRAQSDRRRWYVLSLFAFFLGLLSKVTVVSLPAILVLLIFAERKRITGKDLFALLPFGVLSGIFGIIGIIGKESILASVTPWEVALLGMKSVGASLTKFFVPVHLSVLYHQHTPIVFSSAEFWAPALLLAAIVIAMIAFARRFPLVAFGTAFFLITIAPSFLNLAKGDEIYFASDRYAYLPSVGLLIAIGWLIAKLSDHLPSAKRPLFGGIIAVGVILLSGMAHAQAAVWKDTRSLFQNVLDQYPDSHIALVNLGNIEHRMRNYPKAIEYYERSLALKISTRAYANMGAAYRSLKQPEKALEHYALALTIDPESRQAYGGRATVYADMGKVEEARADFRKAIEISPGYADAYVNWGAMEAELGNDTEAVAMFQKALRLLPDYAQARFNLAVSLGHLGKAEEAMAEYRRLTRDNPEFIPGHINLGILLHQKGDLRGSAEEFRTVLRYDPDNAAARSALRQMRIAD